MLQHTLVDWYWGGEVQRVHQPNCQICLDSLIGHLHSSLQWCPQSNSRNQKWPYNWDLTQDTQNLKIKVVENKHALFKNDHLFT